MAEPSGRSPASRRSGYGPPVAAFVVCVTVFSLATASALAGIPNTETGLFSAMAAVAGLKVDGITVRSSALLLVARLAGVGMLVGLVAVLITKRRLDRRRGAPDSEESVSG